MESRRAGARPREGDRTRLRAEARNIPSTVGLGLGGRRKEEGGREGLGKIYVRRKKERE